MNRITTPRFTSANLQTPAGWALACALLLGTSVSWAADAGRIEATVAGVSNAQGLVGCALFSSKTGFPLESRTHAQATVRVPPAGGTASCVFATVAPGEYAVAVVHDTNGNEVGDTNLLGMPTEGVGVSNNVMPRMSAPTFEAARFTVAGGQTVKLAISIRY
jgi:uncharacterized protein (DUF2141 family)